MNILFIFTISDFQTVKKPLRVQSEIQFGISYISSYLKERGYHTELLVFTRATKYSLIDEYLRKYNIKVVCFHSIFSEYKFVAGIAQYIKDRYPHIFLLGGGPHISLNPEQCHRTCKQRYKR